MYSNVLKLAQNRKWQPEKTYGIVTHCKLSGVLQNYGQQWRSTKVWNPWKHSDNPEHTVEEESKQSSLIQTLKWQPWIHTDRQRKSMCTCEGQYMYLMNLTCPRSRVTFTSLYSVLRDRGGLCHHRSVPSMALVMGWARSLSWLQMSQYWPWEDRERDASNHRVHTRLSPHTMLCCVMHSPHS